MVKRRPKRPLKKFPETRNAWLATQCQSLPTAKELTDYFIDPPPPRTCAQDPCPADAPNYDLYDDQQTPGGTRRHAGGSAATSTLISAEVEKATAGELNEHHPETCGAAQFANTPTSN
jgi:hypothetical protein